MDQNYGKTSTPTFTISVHNQKLPTGMCNLCFFFGNKTDTYFPTFPIYTPEINEKHYSTKRLQLCATRLDMQLQ